MADATKFLNKTEYENALARIKSYIDGVTPTKLSELTDDIVTGHYLPLAGGTITGDLDVGGTFRVLTSVGSCAKLLVYPNNPYGIVFKSAVNGTMTIQSQRESNDSETFPLVLNPSGGNVGVGTSSPFQKLEVNGNVKATSFIKSGGTSSQFLKADGSVDSNTYATTAQLTNGSVTKVGTATVGSANETPVYINAGTPTAISYIHAKHLYGGMNYVGNDSHFVGINPALNYNAYAVQRGAVVKFYLDGVEIVRTDNDSYAKSLFNGLSSCGAQPFDMNSQSTYVAYDSTKSYIVGELCSYTPSGASKKMWYRCTTACSGKVPTNTTYWEDVSATGAYIGVNPTKFTSFKIIVTDLPASIAYEQGLTLFWRVKSQRPRYVTVKKIKNNGDRVNVVNDFTLTGPADCIYLGSVDNAGGQYGIELEFTGFTNTTYWAFSLSQIAFTGNGGSLEGAVLFRGGGTVFGAISPFSNNLADLGTSALRWSTIYGTALNVTTLSASGNTTIGGTLSVSGLSTLAGATMTGDINLATNSKAIVLATASSWTSSDRAIPFSASGEPSKMTYYNDNVNTGLTFNPNTGALKAASFVKRGGTSSQFLKADGSVDSNAYIYGTTNRNIVHGVSSETETWSNLGYADADKGKYNLMVVRHSSSVKNSFGGTNMNYGNTLFFGGADTRAYMGVAYNAPRVVFGGGSLGATSASSVPDWYIILTGSDATTYNLTTIASQAANGNSAYNSLSSYLPLAGGTVTGAIMLSDNNAARIRKDWTGSDTVAALTCNYSGTTTTGFARNAFLLAVDNTVYFRIGMYGSYTANATDNKPSYIYLGQYGYNGLNLRIGMDDTLKWGDHEIWHKGIDAALTPWYHHNYSNGILVTTDFGNNTTQYPLIKIEGRSHNGALLYPVLTYIQSYVTTSGINANASRAYHFGMDLGTIYLFLNSDNKFCIWFEQPNSNSTIWVSVYNKGRYNVIATHENAAMPTEGITSKVTVTAKHNAFEATDVSFTTVASGDISSTGNITTTGNIGIGTTSPTSRLQVISADYSYINTRLSGAAIYFDKLSTNTTGFNNHISFRRVDADMNIVEQVRLIGVYSGSAYTCTYIAGSSYNDSAIRIDGSGTSATVGVGLANAATYKLQVGGNVKANGYYTDGEDGYYNANGSGTYYKNMYMTSGGSLILGYGSAQAGGSTYVSGNILIFRYGTTPTEGMRINASGNVGIGTNSPSYKLHVSGTFRATSTATVSTLVISSTSGVNHINFSRVGGNYINFPASTSSAQSAVCISTGGAASANTILAVVNTTSQAKRVGILNTSPAYTLDVTGIIHSTTGIFSDGYVSAYGVASSSDARLKEGISAISYGRAKEVLSALNPSEWTWKKDGRRGAGMVAQEVQPVLPDTVNEIGGNLTLEYNTAFAYGLAATKYMLPMVESHEEKIARLEKEVEDLRKELKHFKN